jgi:hypothetical protein
MIINNNKITISIIITINNSKNHINLIIIINNNISNPMIINYIITIIKRNSHLQPEINQVNSINIIINTINLITIKTIKMILKNLINSHPIIIINLNKPHSMQKTLLNNLKSTRFSTLIISLKSINLNLNIKHGINIDK